MTSRNSFWASSKENHKRRVWVWIIAFLLQVASYVGVLTVYLSRIRMWNEEGAYRKAGEYQKALYQAAQDALGFQDNFLPVLTGLALIIGMQGFSYLYDRKKVDMYHSVPVDKNKRFLVIYINGILIYLTATLTSLLVGVISAAVQHAVNGKVMTVVGLGFMWNFLMFLVLYHTVVLAVMLTGNRFITLFTAGIFAFYEMMLYSLYNNMQYAFFQTKDDFYISHAPKLSAMADYFGNTWSIKNMETVKEMARTVLPYYGKWFVLAAVLLAIAWLCYRRRPSEAAGKALAFPAVGAAAKVIIVIPAAIGIGMWVYGAGYGNKTLTAVTMVAGGVIGSAVMEVVYDFDLKSLFRHLVSSGIAVAGIIVVFFVFESDAFGYDEYIPSEEKLDSIAMMLDTYNDFWDENFNYVSTAERTGERMHITNVAPVLELASRAQQKEAEDMGDPRCMHVLYRLKSGRKVGRIFYVDFADPANEELLNQIVSTQEYRDGSYQIMTDESSFTQVQAMTYSNGATEVALPAEDSMKLREAFIKDMEKFDFTLARHNRPCGEIKIRFPNWMTYTLEVYDSFENTIDYLESEEAYYPVQLNPEDIDCITVTNYHTELSEEDEPLPEVYDTRNAVAEVDYSYEEDTIVSESFYDQEEFEKIVSVIYPNFLTSNWSDYNAVDNNYDIYITFKKDTAYPYNRSNYGFNYQFFTGQVPEFVIEATALGAD